MPALTITEKFALSLNGQNAEFAMSTKPDRRGNIKTGNAAHFLAFASREAQKDVSLKIYATWLANGTYRPVIKAIVAQLPGSAQIFAQSLIGSGPISKEIFVSFCKALVNMIDDSGKEPKGQKAFYYGLCKSVVNSVNAEDGNGEVVSEQ
jgi:hypothetical protein